MNTLFLISLVLEAIFGIGFILAPVQMLAPMGVALDEASATFARLFGSAIMSFPFLLYFARKSDQSEFKICAVYSLFVYYALSSIFLLKTQLSGQMNSMGWSIVCLHLVFVLWFGYFLIKKRTT
jgi:hypothetical protein